MKRSSLHVLNYLSMAIIWASVYMIAVEERMGNEDFIICQRLLTENIVDIKDMRDVLKMQNRIVRFSHPVSLITLESGIQGVFKHVSNGEDACEVAAFKAAKFLGFPYVPPTVLRIINGTRGSFQLYIPTNFDPAHRGNIALVLKKAHPDDIANLKIFYFVIGQWDTEAHNLLINRHNDSVKIIVIDNGCICSHKHVKYGEYPFLKLSADESLNTQDWNLPFPFERAKTLISPTQESLKDILGSSVPDGLCKWLLAMQPLKYVVYHNACWVSFTGHLKGIDGHPFAYTNYYPEKTIEQLKKLNLEIIKEIFSDSVGLEFLTEEFLTSILERRDQIVAHYNLFKSRSAT